MNIGIIGLGIVGTANKRGFEKLGHCVLEHDTKYQTTINNILDSKIVFLCLPTPSTEDGECDTSIIEDTIQELDSLNYQGIVAIRSTTVPGFTQQMINRYSSLTICFVPEFLRERCAVDDFINNHNLLAVGTDDTWVYNVVVKAHGNLPKNIKQLTPTEAEILKYYNNVYASLRITFANVMYEVCEKLNCDYKVIKDTYLKTEKSTGLYLDVSENLRGYGGMCLPKDTKALALLIKKLNLDLNLIDTVTLDNTKFKKTVFNGMRDEEL